MHTVTVSATLASARRIAGRRLGSLVSLSLIAVIPAQLLQFAAVVLIGRGDSSSDPFQPTVLRVLAVFVAVTLTIAGVLAAFAVSYRLLRSLIDAAEADAGAADGGAIDPDAGADVNVDADASLTHALRQGAPIAGVVAAASVVVAAGLMVFVLPGLLAAVAFSLAVGLALADGLGPTAALSRSRSLVAGRFREVAAVLAAGGAIIAAGAIVAAALVVVIGDGQVTIGSVFVGAAVNVVFAAVGAPLLSATLLIVQLSLVAGEQLHVAGPPAAAETGEQEPEQEAAQEPGRDLDDPSGVDGARGSIAPPPASAPPGGGASVGPPGAGGHDLDADAAAAGSATPSGSSPPRTGRSVPPPGA